MNDIYEDAKERIPTQKETILKMLREAGSEGILNTKLVAYCIGYRSRIAELYQAGYVVDVQHIERGVCRYTLMDEPKVERSPQKAIDMLVEIVNSEYGGSLNAKQLEEIFVNSSLNVVRKHGSHKKVV